MFRDSRGVVHTVCSADPLSDLPGDTAVALVGALLLPDERDLGGALERCEAVRELFERWQDAFFAALPDDLDLAEEARWAAEAGLSLADVEATWTEDADEDADEDEDEDEDELVAEEPDALGADVLTTDLLTTDLLTTDLLELTAPALDDPDDLSRLLPEELVGLLERELLLLPLRVRLEALVAAADLVSTWGDLFADHEKLLGHLLLAHRAHEAGPAHSGHEALARRHAQLHAEHGAGHGQRS